jgi:hypothetical protein
MNAFVDPVVGLRARESASPLVSSRSMPEWRIDECNALQVFVNSAAREL